MNKLTAALIYFTVTFLIVYVLYYFTTLRGYKKNKKKRVPNEIQYLIVKYKLDMKKINKKSFCRIINIIASFDISLVVTVVAFFNNVYLELLIGLALIIPIIIITFSWIGIYYSKKGKTKDEDK